MRGHNGRILVLIKTYPLKLENNKEIQKVVSSQPISFPDLESKCHIV